MGIITGTFGADRIRGTDGIDVVLALSGDDTVIGGAALDTIDGGGGNDTLYANTAAQWSDGALNIVTGGAGDDTIYGGRGDVLSGGDGFDVLNLDLSFGGNAQGVTADFRPMTLLDLGGLLDLKIDGTTLSGFEAIGSLTATSGDDVITLGNRDKSGTIVMAGDGNDSVRSASGADTLNGGNGNDLLTSSGGKDMLIGGAGDDRLFGGRGLDTLKGGEGADSFVFGNERDSSSGRKFADTILDFSHDEHDRISLTRIDAVAGTDSNERFHFVGADRFSGVAGELRSIVFEGDTYVSGDTDGDAKADFTITVHGEVSLVASDFIL